MQGVSIQLASQMNLQKATCFEVLRILGRPVICVRDPIPRLHCYQMSDLVRSHAVWAAVTMNKVLKFRDLDFGKSRKGKFVS